MKQRAGIARILLQAPPMLIVDEPTAGLDPVERVKVRLLLGQLAQSRLVLFSTHIVEDLEETCDTVAILSRGRLVYMGEPDALLQAWEGYVWESPDGELAREPGTRLVSRYARGAQAGWRALAAASPHPQARRARVSLEDALLAALQTGSADPSAVFAPKTP
jgi:ABC-type multidrug transport system ATPase subunit